MKAISYSSYSDFFQNRFETILENCEVSLSNSLVKKLGFDSIYFRNKKNCFRLGARKGVYSLYAQREKNGKMYFGYTDGYLRNAFTVYPDKITFPEKILDNYFYKLFNQDEKEFYITGAANSQELALVALGFQAIKEKKLYRLSYLPAPSHIITVDFSNTLIKEDKLLIA